MSASSTCRFDVPVGQQYCSLFLRTARQLVRLVRGAVWRQQLSGRLGSWRRHKVSSPVGQGWRAIVRRAAGAGFCAITMAIQAAGIFDVRIADEFSRVVDTNTAVLTTNATLNYWLEGPVWVPTNGGGYLVFSSMGSNNRLKKLVPPATVTDYLVPAANTLYNGSALDSQERLISCQSGTAGLRVVMLTNGVVTTLASTCAGLKFYSPNDVVVKSDGTIWFTDPGFDGITANPPQPGYQGGHYVYRFDPANGNATCAPVITNVFRPNGLYFSPDESRLYLADYDNRSIRSYSVTSSNTLSGGSVFASLGAGNGSPDGIRCDTGGRVYSSSVNGIWIYLPDGRLIGRIITSNAVANLCFGGTDWRTLYITAQPNVLSIPLKVAGAVSMKQLQISRGAGSSVRVAWPWPSTGFRLEASPTPGGGTWTQVPDVPSVSNGINLLQITPTNPAAFFRLNKPPP